ncbi:MAG: hypothetical protein ACTHK0_16375 [Ginsengibacter sp.]
MSPDYEIASSPDRIPEVMMIGKAIPNNGTNVRGAFDEHLYLSKIFLRRGNLIL